MADEESPEKQRTERWDGDPAEVVYANVMQIAAGPFDVMLIFGQQDNTARTAENPMNVPKQEGVRVAMSWGHLKSMIPLMAKMVAQYETEVGEIPAPGFEQNWKE